MTQQVRLSPARVSESQAGEVGLRLRNFPQTFHLTNCCRQVSEQETGPVDLRRRKSH